MSNNIIIPVITEKVENKIISQQKNKCARKPYHTIIGLEKYNCLLWKNKKNKGKFVNKEYVIIKKDITDKDISSNNLIALCNQCYSVLNDRSKNKISSEESSELSDPKIINEYPEKYKIVYYPSEPGILNIREFPNIESKILGYVYYGDIIDVCEIENSKWIKTSYSEITGFIKKICKSCIVMEKIIITPIPPLSEKECCICFEKITEKHALVPCGHTTICKDCSTTLNKCPLCTQEITTVIKIFD